MKFLVRYAAFSPPSMTPCTEGLVPACHSILRHSSPILLNACSLCWRSQAAVPRKTEITTYRGYNRYAV